MSVLLTGATGFVGGEVLQKIPVGECRVMGRARPECIREDHFFEYNIGGQGGGLNSVFDGVTAVVHCAARAHVMNDKEVDPLSIYREVNTTGTLNLARQAAASGVKRFVFISSIKVNGETTTGAPTFTESDLASMEDPYAISKAEAESGLWLIAKETGMEVVIIRPPLVYGPGVKANFFNLMKLANSAAPLPFGAIHNKRSMVYVANLADFIVQCVEHPAAANQTFLISDGRDFSLRDLLTQLRLAMGKSPRLIPVPVFLFRLAGKLAGKQMLIDRLTGDLQVDSSKAVDLLGWTPPFTVEHGIQATVDAFLKGSK